MNAPLPRFPYHEHELDLIDLSASQRRVSMTSMGDEEPFLAELLDGRIVIASYHSTSTGMLGEDRYEVEGEVLPASAFRGAISMPRRPRAVHVPMIPETDLPPATERYEAHCEEEANDRAAGREWR